MSNCTIADNTADNDGGGIWNGNSGLPADIINSILWGNTDGPGGTTTTAQITNAGSTNAAITYSDVQGGYSGTGNIGALAADDPDFADASEGSYQL